MATAVEKAQAALNKAKKKEADDKRDKQISINNYCIGKCFKRISSHDGHRYLDYYRVLDRIKYKDGTVMYGMDKSSLVAENVNLKFSIVGYSMNYGQLKYYGPNQRVHLPIRQHYKKGRTISPENKYNHGYITPTSVNVEKGTINITSGNIYIVCSEEEFIDAMETALAINEYAAKQIKPLMKDVENRYDPKLFNITQADNKLLETLLKKVDKKEVDLGKFITIAKLTRQFYSYTNNELTDLTQSNQFGDSSGLNLDIVGTDGGSDYEPYVTGYRVDFVNIDWQKVLYKIRLKLDSVQATAKELEAFKEVYNTDNWSVNWFGSYDVTFGGAILYGTILKGVNQIIKSHIK